MSESLDERRRRLQREVQLLEQSLSNADLQLLSSDSDESDSSEDSTEDQDQPRPEPGPEPGTQSGPGSEALLLEQRDLLHREIQELERTLGPTSSFTEDQTDEEDDSSSSDESELELPRSVESCLQMNLVYQQVLQETLDQLDSLLQQNQNQQKELLVQISGSDRDQTKPRGSSPQQQSSNVYLGNFLKPYFKDRLTGLGPPANQETREKSGRLVGSLDNKRLRIRRWEGWQKVLLIHAVSRDRLRKLIQPKLSRLDFLTQKLASASTSDSDKTQISDQIQALEKDIQALREKKEEELIGDRFEDVDWARISNIDFEGSREPGDLQCFWQNFLHPSIKKERWSDDEISRLKELSLKNQERDWAQTSLELGTGRTAFMCLQTYQRFVSDSLRKKKWSPEEDAQLRDLVEKMRMGNFIPYTQMCYFMEDRLPAQLIYRWNHVLDPRLKKGPWSPEEDQLLLAAVEKHGAKNWWKIRYEVPGRTDGACRDRYYDCLKADTRRGAFDEKEKLMLLRLVQKHGVGRWAKIAAEIPNRTDAQCMREWKKLMRNMGSYSSKETRKEAKKEAPKETRKEAKKEAPKETRKEAKKEAPKETRKEAKKEAKKEAPKETRKEAKKETRKEVKKDRAEEAARTVGQTEETSSPRAPQKPKHHPAVKKEPSAPKRTQRKRKSVKLKEEFVELVSDEEEQEEVPYMDNSDEEEKHKPTNQQTESEEQPGAAKVVPEQEFRVPHINDWIPRKLTSPNASFCFRPVALAPDGGPSERRVRCTIVEKSGTSVLDCPCPKELQWDERHRSDVPMMITAEVLTLILSRQAYKFTHKKGQKRNTQRFTEVGLTYELQAALVPWVGNVVVRRDRPTVADVLRKRGEELKLSSTKVFRFFLQALQVDAEGCKLMIEERRRREELRRRVNPKTVAGMVELKQLKQKAESSRQNVLALATPPRVSVLLPRPQMFPPFLLAPHSPRAPQKQNVRLLPAISPKAQNGCPSPTASLQNVQVSPSSPQNPTRSSQIPQTQSGPLLTAVPSVWTQHGRHASTYSPMQNVVSVVSSSSKMQKVCFPSAGLKSTQTVSQVTVASPQAQNVRRLPVLSPSRGVPSSSLQKQNVRLFRDSSEAQKVHMVTVYAPSADPKENVRPVSPLTRAVSVNSGQKTRSSSSNGDAKERTIPAPDAKTQDAKTQDAKTQDAKERTVPAPDAKAPDAKIPYAKTQDAKTQDAKVLFLSASDQFGALSDHNYTTLSNQSSEQKRSRTDPVDADEAAPDRKRRRKLTPKAQALHQDQVEKQKKRISHENKRPTKPQKTSTPPSNPSLPPSHPSLPPSHPSLPPSHPFLPPSHPSLPPSHPSLPPSHPSLPPSNPSLPPSHPSLPPSHPSLPTSNPSLPPSLAPLPPSIVPLRPSLLPLLPSLAPFPPSLAPLPPSIAPLPPSLAPFPPSLAPLPPSIAPLPPSLPLLPPSIAPFPPSLAPLPPSIAPLLPSIAPLPPSIAPLPPSLAPLPPSLPLLPPSIAPLPPSLPLLPPSIAPLPPSAPFSFVPPPVFVQSQSVPNRPITSQHVVLTELSDWLGAGREEQKEVSHWLSGEGGVAVEGMQNRKLPYLPPFVSTLSALSLLLRQKAQLSRNAEKILQQRRAGGKPTGKATQTKPDEPSKATPKSETGTTANQKPEQSNELTNKTAPETEPTNQTAPETELTNQTAPETGPTNQTAPETELTNQTAPETEPTNQTTGLCSGQPSNQEPAGTEEAELTEAVRRMVRARFGANPAYQLLKARFLSVFTVPALLASLQPVTEQQKAEGEEPITEEPITEQQDAEREEPITEEPITEQQDTEGEEPITEQQDTEGEEPITEQQDTEGEAPITEEPITEQQDTEGEEPITEEPITEQQDTEGEEPITEQQDTEGEEPITEQQDTEGEEPITEQQDTEGEAPITEEPITEQQDTEGEEPITEEPITEQQDTEGEEPITEEPITEQQDAEEEEPNEGNRSKD